MSLVCEVDKSEDEGVFVPLHSVTVEQLCPSD